VRRRDQRGVALPSPVVLLSAAAVLLAAIAFFATRGHGSDQVDLTSSQPTPSAAPTTPAKTKPAKPQKTKPAKPTVDRSKVKVVVYNNTNIKGLAGTVGDQVKKAGWDFQAADNWQGTVPATTVYYGDGLKAAADQLGLDLGIKRVVPRDTAATGMLADGLTVILVGPLS
jgi:hypothetical protein